MPTPTVDEWVKDRLSKEAEKYGGKLNGILRCTQQCLPEDAYILTPRTFSSLHMAKGTTGRQMLKDFLLRWGGGPDFWGKPNVITRVLIWEQEQPKRGGDKKMEAEIGVIKGPSLRIWAASRS